MKQAFLCGVSYYLPKNKLTNSDIALAHPEWSIEKIATKTGISERRVSGKDEYVSDMAIKAACELFEEYKIDKSTIDFVLLCTQNPDYSLPTTACILQSKLGLSKNIGALDFNLGCSGYVYGLGLAKGLILSGQANNVLLLTSDTYTKIIHEDDRSNKTLFGDGATASLVSSSLTTDVDSFEILDFCYGTDGSGYDNLIVKNSGARRKCFKTEDRLNEDGQFVRNDDYLYMDGNKIFNFTAFNVPLLVNQVIDKNRVIEKDISHYVFHQANAFMLDFIRKRCNIEKEKFFVSMDDIGNTVSSSIPIALKRLFKSEEDSCSSILLCGFGVGLSLGGVIIRKHEN